MVGRPSGSRVGLPLLLLLLGFLVSTGVLQERLRERELPSRAQELRRLVLERREDVRQLASEVHRLAAELDALQGSLAQGSSRVRELVARADKLRGPAGMAALRGPAVVVELADSPRAPASRGEEVDLRIQDVDLQLLVNLLWRAGAEAVAVNGRRVISTTAIRQAGGTILVNYRAVTSPYRVVAIGDAPRLQERLADSDVARRFSVWQEIYGLGFDVDRVREASVPAPDGLPSLRWSRPVLREGS